MNDKKKLLWSIGILLVGLGGSVRCSTATNSSGASPGLPERDEAGVTSGSSSGTSAVDVAASSGGGGGVVLLHATTAAPSSASSSVSAGLPVEGGTVGPDASHAGSSAPTPGCATAGDGVTNCGAGAGGESCCTSPDVTGGTYDRTYSNNGGAATGLADPATISPFRLDKYLVTVGRFRQYVAYLTGGTGAPPPNGSGIHAHLNGGLGLVDSAHAGAHETGWDAANWNAQIATGPAATTAWNTNLVCGAGYSTWTTAAGAQEKLPINCVNWYEASAFCIWDGGFLPSEAEWEYAAAGGSQQRAYPWGATAPGMGNQYAITGDGESNCYYPTGTAAPCTGVANFAPVGTASQGAGAFGQLDLVGEVFEWNLDWYAPYAACTDCADLTPTSNRVMRGDLLNDTSLLTPSSRFDVNPDFRAVNLGFRCARSPLGTTTAATTAASTGTTTGTATGTTVDTVGATSPGMDAAVSAPAGCTVPSPVGFQSDIQPFLNASCGKTGAANASNGGCHVLDSESTMIEGGKNHAYDWITGTAHASSCPETPTPLRFQVVMAVMQEDDPPSCSACPKMPSATTPPRAALTACQLATLQAWLDEAYVTQFHRYDGISPTTPYPMPPWN